jgi:hypothetical protein
MIRCDCPKCDHEWKVTNDLAGKRIRCPNCDKRVLVPGEQVFFESDGVLVTSARFVVDDKTYAMSGVTSVSAFEMPSLRASANVFLILGLATLCVGVGVLFILIWIAILLFAKRKYGLRVHTSGIEESELEGQDGRLIKRVADAVNESIIARG